MSPHNQLCTHRLKRLRALFCEKINLNATAARAILTAEVDTLDLYRGGRPEKFAVVRRLKLRRKVEVGVSENRGP